MKKRFWLSILLVITLCLLASAAMATTTPKCSDCGSTEHMVFVEVRTDDSTEHPYGWQYCVWKCTLNHPSLYTGGEYWSYFYHNGTSSCPYCGSAPYVSECQNAGYTVVPATATCDKDGCREYYICNGCNLIYSDSCLEDWCQIYDLNEWKNGDGFLDATGKHNTELVNGQAAGCTTAGYKDYYRCKDCEKTFSDATGKDEIVFSTWSAEGGNGYIKKTGHAYGDATYTWEDNQCTAKRACTNTGCSASVSETQGTYVKDTDATCTAAETGHYEAVYSNPSFTTQKTATGSVTVGNPLGHEFGTAAYIWNDDQCTAERACTHTGCTEKETETVTGSYVKDTDATCTDAEAGHYEAAFTNTAFEAQKTAAGSVTVGDPLGHKDGEWAAADL